MRIGFIGAGKVGMAFGSYLKQKGVPVYGYYSRRFESARLAAEMTGSMAEQEMASLVKHSDILFITTGDDEIGKVCNTLAEQDLLAEGQILVHMSGVHSSQLLSPAKEKGCYTFSLHPLQAFADVKKAAEDLENTVFSIEGDGEKIDDLEKLLKQTGNQYFKLTAEQKGIYHAAACVMSNYLVTLMDYGLSLYKTIGIEESEAFKALSPLIRGTLDNILKLGTEHALTGPIARGDVHTVKMHLEALKKNHPDELEFYKIFAFKSLELAKKQKLKDKQKENALKKVLREV